MKNKILITNPFKFEDRYGYFPANAVEVHVDGKIAQRIVIPFAQPFQRKADRSKITETVAALKKKYGMLDVQDNPMKTGRYWSNFRDSQTRRDNFIKKNGFVYRTDLPRAS